MPGKITREVADLDIGNRIWNQVCHLIKAAKLNENEKNSFLRTVVEVMKKLEAAKYHKDNCERIILTESEKRKTEEDPIGDIVHVDLTTGAEKELEAFIMQGKSCLDVLAKTLKPLTGTFFHSFGDSGEKIAKHLRNLGQEKQSAIEPLVRLIEEDKEWIERWFKGERDTISHYKS